MDSRILLFIVLGLSLWGAVAVDGPLRRLPISPPMLYTALGWLIFTLPLGLPLLDPAGNETHTVVAEYLTEFVVIISLMAAGLAIDRPVSWTGWGQVWPLIGVTMPLSILAVGWLGWAWLGLAPAAALLLAAALSPTDPILEQNVQVGPPGESERDDVRFDLSVEAGINDALAFPFTHLAIAAAGATSLGGWLVEWALVDLLWRVGAGLLVGFLLARLGSWYIFARSSEISSDTHADDDRGGRTNEGLVVMATALAAYGIAELIEGYGFLAVFASAVTARQRASHSNYHERTHRFTDQIEDMVLVAMLLGFGGLLASGVLSALTLPAALIGLAVIFIIRPLTGMIGLLGSDIPWLGRFAVAFLGIRGIGTLYYLSYGQTHAAIGETSLLWATATFVILLSILIHGVTAVPLLRWVKGQGAHVTPGKKADVAEDA